MSTSDFRNLFVALFLSIAGLGSVLAQTITVNGGTTPCPNAKVTFGAGTIAIDTGGCGTTATPPTITVFSPPAGTVSSAYSYPFGATGTPTPAWSIVAGTQPNGLTLSSAGVLSGTPTTAASFTFTVQAANGASPNATQQVTILINPPSGPPVITSLAPPSPVLGQNYSFTPSATGAQPITWSAPGRPAWALFDTNTGALSGTPTAGMTSFTLTAMNSVSSVMQNVTWNVTAPIAPAITSGNPTATGTVGTAYSFPFAASGSPTIVWTINSGAPPTGVTINSSTGVLSGTPTTAGTYTFTVKAANGTMPDAIAPATPNNFSVTISPNAGCAGTTDISGACIPSPSKTATTNPASHAGVNGAGELYAWSVNPARCDNTVPTITSSWHHIFDIGEHGDQGKLDNFDMGPNEAMTFEFTPTALGPGQVLIGSNGRLPFPATFVSISTKPCDFNLAKLSAPPARDYCFASATADNGIGYEVTNGTVLFGCKLTPGTKYYLNIRWQDGRPGSSANMADSCAARGLSRCGLYTQFRR